MNLEALRREYLHGGLMHADLNDHPIQQFERWLEQAIALDINDPTAMVMASVDSSGQPSQRIVLLKGISEAGFVFYTNYGSRKGREMAANAQVSLLFPWHAIDRQVKVLGRVERMNAIESAAYFASRPRDSQLAAWASPQSQQVPSRQALMDSLEEMRQRFEGQEVPLPDNWGGLRVIPHEVEFWQGGAHRLHDRFQYTLQPDEQWLIKRLAP